MATVGAMSDPGPIESPPLPEPSPEPPPGRPVPDLALLDRVERELDDVEQVLPRLDDGTYGICDLCGARIGDERLATNPATRRCTEHPQGS